MFDPKVILYTKLLKHRIANNARIDVNIFHLIEAEHPKSYNEHLGRYLGWFVITEERPGFLLLARQKIGEDISHACLIYPNTNHEDFPLLERKMINQKLSKEPKLAVINVVSKTAQFCEYAILLEAVQCVLSRDIFKERPPLYISLKGPGSLTSPPELHKQLTTCKAELSDAANLIHQVMLDNQLMVVDLDQTISIPRSFNIMRMQYSDHFVYGINYKEEQAMLLLLPHIEQFPHETYFVELEEKIEKVLPGQFKVYHAVRPRIVTECNSAAILKICILLTRIPLLFIDPSDVSLALDDLNILSIGSSQKAVISKSPQKSKSAYIEEYRGPKPNVTLRLTGVCQRPKIVSVRNKVVSQELSMNSQEAIRREINDYRAWMSIADDLSASWPSTLEIKSVHDPKGDILTKSSWLMGQLPYVIRYWAKFSTVKLLQPLSIIELGRRHFDDKVERFIVAPIRSGDDLKDCGTFIFDKEAEIWRWMHPDNCSKDSKQQLKAASAIITKHFPSYAKWKGDILIISSSYHKGYPYAHLLMGLYRIAKCFQYSVQLPLKVVYNERDFRMYLYHYCLALQVSNQEYNLNNDLVTEDGRLKFGARVSLPSPVQYERAVVPSDQCPFCKKRGYGNLGRHMSMKHGGQAIAANITRQVQYGYSSKES